MRSVSATCASGASAGWQQVKISRRRSSGISLGVAAPAPRRWPLGRWRRRSPASPRTRLAADAVDGLVSGRLDDPGARELGNAGGRPLIDRGRERLLGRLFGHVEVADQPDQRGDDPAPVGAIDHLHGGIGVRGHAGILCNSSRRRVDPGPRRSTLLREEPYEVHAADLPESRTRGPSSARRERQHVYVETAEAGAGPARQRAVPGRPPAAPVVGGDQRPGARRQAARDRRPLRGDARAPGRLLPDRRQGSRRSHRHRHADSRGEAGTVEVRPVREGQPS